MATTEATMMPAQAPTTSHGWRAETCAKPSVEIHKAHQGTPPGAGPVGQS